MTRTVVIRFNRSYARLFRDNLPASKWSSCPTKVVNVRRECQKPRFVYRTVCLVFSIGSKITRFMSTVFECPIIRFFFSIYPLRGRRTFRKSLRLTSDPGRRISQNPASRTVRIVFVRRLSSPPPAPDGNNYKIRDRRKLGLLVSVFPGIIFLYGCTRATSTAPYVTVPP